MVVVWSQCSSSSDELCPVVADQVGSATDQAAAGCAVTHEIQGPLTGSLFDSKETIIMTATKNPTVAMCPSPLVLFGIDSRGKPKGPGFERSTPAWP
jgi:hypothetical protein